MAGTVTRCEPPRLLAFTFGSTGDSEAMFELTPQGKNVRMVVTHRGRGEDLDYLEEFASGWHAHLALLLTLLEGRPVPSFGASHARYKVQYERMRRVAQQG